MFARIHYHSNVKLWELCQMLSFSVWFFWNNVRTKKSCVVLSLMAKLLLLLSLWSSIREVSQLPGLNSKYSPSFSTFNNPQYSIFILRLTFARFLIKSTKGLHGESIWKPDVEQISFVELNFQLFWRFWEWSFGQPTKMYSWKKNLSKFVPRCHDFQY